MSLCLNQIQKRESSTQSRHRLTMNLRMESKEHVLLNDLNMPQRITPRKANAVKNDWRGIERFF